MKTARKHHTLRSCSGSPPINKIAVYFRAIQLLTIWVNLWRFRISGIYWLLLAF